MNNEILGLIATIFVLISFLLSGEKEIRKINMVGALLFVVYGIVIGALSVWLLNGILFFIHLYKLNGITKENKLKSREVGNMYGFKN